jgi:hypothetical protein
VCCASSKHTGRNIRKKKDPSKANKEERTTHRRDGDDAVEGGDGFVRGLFGRVRDKSTTCRARTEVMTYVPWMQSACRSSRRLYLWRPG